MYVVKVCHSAAIFVLCTLALACSPSFQPGSESAWTITEDNSSRTGASAQLPSTSARELPALVVSCNSWQDSRTREWTTGLIMLVRWDVSVVDRPFDYLQVRVGWDDSEPKNDMWTSSYLDELLPSGFDMESYMTKLRESETLYLRVVRLDSEATFRLSGSDKVLESFENECLESAR